MAILKASDIPEEDYLRLSVEMSDCGWMSEFAELTFISIDADSLARSFKNNLIDTGTLYYEGKFWAACQVNRGHIFTWWSNRHFVRLSKYDEEKRQTFPADINDFIDNDIWITASRMATGVSYKAPKC